MRTFLAVVVAIVVLAIAAAALAPAALLAPLVERATRQRLAVTETEGRLWHGRGVLAAGNVRVPVAWDADALPLLGGELAVRVTPGDANAATPRAKVSAAAQRIAITDLDLVLPAGVVEQALRNAPIKPGWSAEGEIAVATPRIEWTPSAFGGGLDVVWRNARVILVSKTPVDAGELTVQLAGAGNRLAGPVRNRGGNLDVRGDLAFGTDGSATVSVVLTPRNAEDTELARALAGIGTPDGAGWRVNWQTMPR